VWVAGDSWCGQFLLLLRAQRLSDWCIASAVAVVGCGADFGGLVDLVRADCARRNGEGRSSFSSSPGLTRARRGCAGALGPA
jgi:hypothetical protein